MSISDPIRWPHDVRQAVLRDGFALRPGVQAVETTVERGAPRGRRLSSARIEEVDCTQRLPRAEYLAFSHWVFNDVQSTREFQRGHPFHGPSVPVRCSFILQDGDPFTLSPDVGDNVLVAFRLRITVPAGTRLGDLPGTLTS